MHGEQKSYRRRQNLWQMGCKNKRQHQVSLPSAKNRNQLGSLRLEKKIQNKSHFLLQHADDGVRIWHQQHESIRPSLPCINSSGCWWCGLLYTHIGPLNTNQALVWMPQCVFRSIVAEHMHTCIVTVHPFSNSYFQHENVTKHLKLVS